MKTSKPIFASWTEIENIEVFIRRCVIPVVAESTAAATALTQSTNPNVAQHPHPPIPYPTLTNLFHQLKVINLQANQTYHTSCKAHP